MPELPDIVTYLRALESRIIGQRLIRVRVASTFLLRSAQPPIHEVDGRIVRELRRIGKRIAIGVENDLWLVLHLMIAGRLHWRPPQASLAGRNNRLLRLPIDSGRMSGNGCSLLRVTRLSTGSIAVKPKPDPVSPTKSLRFTREWSSMAVTGSRARDVAKRFCVFATPITRQTTVPDVRRAE